MRQLLTYWFTYEGGLEVEVDKDNLEKLLSLTFAYCQVDVTHKKVKLVGVIPYYLVVLVNWGKEQYQIFTSAGAGEEKLYEGTGYYQGNTAQNLVNKLRTLQPDKKWADHLKVIWNWGTKEYLWENIYTTDAYQ